MSAECRGCAFLSTEHESWCEKSTLHRLGVAEAENRRLKEELEAEWEASGKAARLNADLQAQLAQAQSEMETERCGFCGCLRTDHLEPNADTPVCMKCDDYHPFLTPLDVRSAIEELGHQLAQAQADYAILTSDYRELSTDLAQAQARAELADEAMRGFDTVKVLAEWLHGFLQQQAIHAHPSIFSQCPHITCTRWRDWLARYDALSSPTPEPEGVTDD